MSLKISLALFLIEICCSLNGQITITDGSGDEILGRILLDAGSDLSLGCEIPVPPPSQIRYPEWLKCQEEFALDGDDSCGNEALTTYGGIFSNQELYEDKERFSIETPKSHKQVLHIRNVVKTDSGWYRCKALTEDKVIGVFVKESISSLEMYINSGNKNATSLPDTLSLTSSETINIRCVTVGGMPRPNIQVMLLDSDGGEEIINNNQQNINPNAADVLRKSDKIHYDRYGSIVTYEIIETGIEFEPDYNQGQINYTLDWQGVLVVKPEYNDKKLQCRATVPESRPIYKRADIDVSWAPILMDCFGEEFTDAGDSGFILRDGIIIIDALIGDSNVVLTCTVSANPTVSSVKLTEMSSYIEVKTAGTNALDIALTLQAYKPGDGYNTTYTVTFPALTQEHMGQYTFSISNAFGNSAKSFKLDNTNNKSFRDHSTGQSTNAAATLTTSFIIMFLSILYVFGLKK